MLLGPLVIAPTVEAAPVVDAPRPAVDPLPLLRVAAAFVAGLRGKVRRLTPTLAKLTQPQTEAIEMQVHDWRRIKREQLADDEATDDRYAQRLPKLRAITRAQSQGHRAEQRGHGRHH